MEKIEKKLSNQSITILESQIIKNNDILYFLSTYINYLRKLIILHFSHKFKQK